MPTYSYRCTECDNAFDIQQSFTDDSLTVCPVCGAKLRKVFSPVGVTFSGSGFYRTDSRAADKGSADKGSADKGSSDKGSSDKGSAPGTPAPKSETKSESKPSATPSTPSSSPGSTSS